MGCLRFQIALPSQITTETCYLDLYIQHILALQEASGSYGSGIPLVIMTSDDTHSKTQKLLEDNKYFGMSADQVHLLKQVTFMHTALKSCFEAHRVGSDDLVSGDHLHEVFPNSQEELTTLTLYIQEKVACLADNDARIALDPSDPYLIQVCTPLASSLGRN
jgi:hypothetical protein